MPNLIENGSVVMEKQILNLLDVLLQFHYYLSSEKDVALHLIKLKSPSPKEAISKAQQSLQIR